MMNDAAAVLLCTEGTELSRKKIIVIGAGASGLMAAAAAAAEGAQVTVLEKNEKAGKKIYITGKGRCNLTNVCPDEDFFDFVASNPKFLYSAIYGFDHDMVMEFMRENGCEVKVERGGRVFPVTDHASDVTKALLHALRKYRVDVRYHARVKKILTGESGHVAGVQLADKEKMYADAVIVCTGGLSYPSTGSTGDGLRMAKDLDISVTPTAPSLVPFSIKEGWCRELQGLSLKNIQISVYPVRGGKKKPVITQFGEMLFTHFGVSGPVILTASCYCRFDRYPDGFILHLDTKPALSEEKLAGRIRREISAAPSKILPNLLRALLPQRLAETVAGLSGIRANRKAASLSDTEIQGLVRLIKDIPMTVTGTRGYAEAVITRGGISVSEVNPSTMESRRYRGLFFAGEVLDVDAQTGGYNLQIAWSTGHLAGISAAGSDRADR